MKNGKSGTSHHVFVTVGSTDFDPLVQAVDTLIPELSIGGIMQIGHGKYEPKHLPFFRFDSPLETYYQQASVVIAHGGLATTMEVLKCGVPLVSVSNTDRYDNHQDDLLSVMAEEGYLVWCQQLTDLKQAIERVQTTSLRPYEEPDCSIHHMIYDFLSS